MQAPLWVCKELSRLDSGFRIGWVGRNRKYPDELNPGDFALVSLAKKSDIGDLGQPRIPNELWSVTDKVDAFGQVYRARIDRGPIFNKEGGLTPDWDQLFYVPVYIAKFVDYGLTNEAVVHGAVIALVREWQTSLKNRVLGSAARKGRELKETVQEMAREQGKFLWREAQKSTSTRTPTAWKHAREEVNKFYKQKEHGGIENYYDPTKDMR
jgi:hypothetical protein